MSSTPPPGPTPTSPVPDEDDEPLWSGRLLSEVHVPFDLRPAWRRDDAAIERDAIAFWNRLGILPNHARPEARAKELAAAAYQDSRLCGVATVNLARLEQLRGRFAFLRCAVDPEHRRSYAARALTKFSRDLLEAWSAENPQERVLGLAVVVQSAQLTRRQRCPVWVNTQLNLVGHTDKGDQIRVSWFAHAVLDPPDG
jgi:hypothetical protein